MQVELNQALWNACSTSRGNLEAADYRNYLLTLLFLKYLTDVKGHLANGQFVLPDQCSFHYLYENRLNRNIGLLINQALHKLSASNKALEGVFSNMDFNNEARLGGLEDRVRVLRRMLEGFQPLNLSPDRVGSMDVIGNAYEYLLGRFAAGSGRQAGEFYTPPEVAELLIGLADPRPGERICDPTCGSGSLLIRCGAYLKKQGACDFGLFGQEITPTTWALAKMNMVLHGLNQSVIQQGDTLRNPRLLDSNGQLTTFHVVIANPPFSKVDWGKEIAQEDPYQRFHRGVPSKSKGDYAFLSHMVKIMHLEAGRVCVVVPNGALFRKGGEGTIRKALIEENLVDCIIGLPRELFYGTAISTSIMVLRRNKRDHATLFINAENMWERQNNRRVLAPDKIRRILQVVDKRQTVHGVARLADLNEIRTMKHRLDVGAYVMNQAQQPVKDPGETFRRLEAAEKLYRITWDNIRDNLKGLGYDV